MNLELLRYSGNKDSTNGLLFVDGKFFCHTLEDEHRDEKVRGKTRIPEGTYQLGLRKSETPLTLNYRNRFPWFKFHIEILNIPNFSGVYIHIGNDHTDTDGCILVGDAVDGERLSKSTLAFERIYKLLFDHLDKGNKATIWIHRYYAKL